MIKNIIFDFGDIFINLDKTATEKSLVILGVDNITQQMLHIAQLYEMGLISSAEFINSFRGMYPSITANQFKDAWNAILLDTPQYRMDFIQALSKSDSYRLFLLSNTNEMHINWIQEQWGMDSYKTFKNCFEQFYLSYQIKLRKPNFDIYEFVLEENGIHAEETYFIDDTKENTETAAALGIRVWNLNPAKEDIVELLKRKELAI